MPSLLDAGERQAELHHQVAHQVVRRRAVEVHQHEPALLAGRPPEPAECLGQPVGALLDLDGEDAGQRGELGQGRGPDQPSRVDRDQVVADPLDLPQEVRRHDDRDAELGADPVDECEHLLAPGGVQPGRRLVEEQQARIVDQRLGELDALAHPGRIAADGAVPLLVQADVTERLGGPLPCRGRGQAAHARHVGDEVGGADVRRQAVVLRHVPHPLPDLAPMGRGVHAQHRGASRGRPDQAEQHLQQGRLPRAVGADQPHDPAVERERDAVERGDAGISLGQAVGGDQRHPLRMEHGRNRAHGPADP